MYPGRKHYVSAPAGVFRLSISCSEAEIHVPIRNFELVYTKIIMGTPKGCIKKNYSNLQKLFRGNRVKIDDYFKLGLSQI